MFCLKWLEQSSPGPGKGVVAGEKAKLFFFFLGNICTQVLVQNNFFWWFWGKRWCYDGGGDLKLKT